MIEQVQYIEYRCQMPLSYHIAKRKTSQIAVVVKQDYGLNGGNNVARL